MMWRFWFRSGMSTLLSFLPLLAHAEEFCSLSLANSWDGPVNFELYDASRQAENTFMALETNLTLFDKAVVSGVVRQAAQSYEFNEDEDELVVQIDPSCHWSDGRKVTAHDFLAGFYESFSAENLGSYNPYRFVFKNSSEVFNGDLPVTELGIRALNERTLAFDVIVSKQDMLLALTEPMMTPLPTHLTLEELENWRSGAFTRTSSGAFQGYSQNAHELVLVANKYYCADKKSNVNKVVYKNAYDVGTEALMVKNKELDVSFALSANNHESLREYWRNQEEIAPYVSVDARSTTLAYLLLSDENKLGSLEVRREILGLIDRKFLQNYVVGLKPTHQKALNFADYIGGHVPSPIPLNKSAADEAQLKRAKARLAQFGIDESSPLALTLSAPEKRPYEQTALALKSLGQRLPIEIKLVSQEEEADLRLGTVSSYENIDNVKFEQSLEDVYDQRFVFSTPRDANQYVRFFADQISPELSERARKNLYIKNAQRRERDLNDINEALIQLHRAIPLFEYAQQWLVSNEVQFLDGYYPLARNVFHHGCVHDSESN